MFRPPIKDGSNERAQHIFLLRNKNKNFAEGCFAPGRTMCHKNISKGFKVIEGTQSTEIYKEA